MVSLTTVVLAGATHSASVSGPVTVVVTVTPALQCVGQWVTWSDGQMSDIRQVFTETNFKMQSLFHFFCFSHFRYLVYLVENEVERLRVLHIHI